MQALNTAIRQGFFDSTAGYYREHAEKHPNDRPYSYLWPICALFQAGNEMEKVEKGGQYLQPTLRVIRDYHDPSAPRAGYASYLMKFNGGTRFYDDNQWIGITAMDAYDRLKDTQYLALGTEIYSFMMSGFDTVAGGGLYWEEGNRKTKNTCSNGPGVILALQLYKATGRKAYLDTALLLYNWVNTKLRTPSGLYYDNIKTADGSIGRQVYSYNTGTMMQSAIYLYECTGNRSYLQTAISMADSSAAFFLANGRFRDNYWFSAVLLRAYQHLLKHHKDPSYLRAFQACLDHSLRTRRNDQGLFRSHRNSTLDLVAHGGMLEILARFAQLQDTE